MRIPTKPRRQPKRVAVGQTLLAALAFASACATVAPAPAEPQPAAPLGRCPSSVGTPPLDLVRPGVVGCPIDVHVREGTYEGYQVSFGCSVAQSSNSLVVLRGLGAKLGPARPPGTS